MLYERRARISRKGRRFKGPREPRNLWALHWVNTALQERPQRGQQPTKERSTLQSPKRMRSWRYLLSLAVHEVRKEVIMELGRRTTNTTLDKLETSYLFQQISVAVQRGNAICFTSTFPC